MELSESEPGPPGSYNTCGQHSPLVLQATNVDTAIMVVLLLLTTLLGIWSFSSSVTDDNLCQ